MKAALRILFFLTVYFFSFSLLAQKNAPFLIQIAKMEIREVGNPELEYLQIWADAVAISTPSSFPKNKIEGHTFFPVIRNADGIILYDGYKAINGSSNVDTTLISKSRKLLFSIPAEYLGAAPGSYNVKVELYSMHESGEQKLMIESKAHKLIVPKFDYISWTINSLKIPDSESYDTRFLFAKHIACNADLYVRIQRSGSQIFRSSSSDNTCYITNVQCNSYTSAKSSWRISAVDYDGTSFDDLVESFDIGQVTNGIEKEMTVRGSTLNYKVSTSARPVFNPYQYNVHSYIRKHDGVSGIAYSLKGNLLEILAPDFSLAHFAGNDKIESPLSIASSADSLLYFVPFHQYEPGTLRMHIDLTNTFTKDEVARYTAFQELTIPAQLPDNEITGITTSYEKIRGTMCLKISGTSVIPASYFKKGTLYAACRLGGVHSKIDSIALFQATSNFSFVVPLHTLDEKRKSIALNIETFLYSQRENFPKKKRFFRSYADSLKNIAVEMENASFRVFAKVNKKYVATANWRIADCFSDQSLAEKKSGEAYTDFTVRKHKDDDLKLVLHYEGADTKKDELVLNSAMLAQKGKKIKLKSLKGAGKIKLMRM